MSEQPGQHDPEQEKPLDQRNAEDWHHDKIKSFKDIHDIDKGTFDSWAEDIETSFTDEERQAVEGLNADHRHELVDMRNDFEARLEHDPEVNDKIDALVETLREHSGEEIRTKLRAALYEAEVGDYIDTTFPSPENEGEEDVNAKARESARALLLVPRERFNEITNKWDNLDAVETVRAELAAEEDEAFALNETMDTQATAEQSQEPLLQEGRTITSADGTEYRIISVEKDAEGNPTNVHMNINNPHKRHGRRRIVRVTAEEATNMLSPHVTEAGEESSPAEGQGSEETTEPAESAESTLEGIDEEVEQLRDADRNQAEAARIAAEIEEELRRLNERFRNDTMPENLRQQIDDILEQVREVERQIAEAVEQARAQQAGAGGTEGTGTGTEGTGNEGEGSPGEGEGGAEEETQPLRFRDRLRLAATLLRANHAPFRERVNDAVDVLTNRGNRGQENGERNGRRKILKWAVGAGAVILAGGALWAAIANRDDIGQTLHDYFSGETGGTAGRPDHHALPQPGETGGAGGVDTGGSPQGYEFGDAARTAEPNEGWFNTITETTGIRNQDQLRTILNDVGPELARRGEAYVAPDLGGYGISRPGQLSQRALELIQQSAERNGFTTR